MAHLIASFGKDSTDRLYSVMKSGLFDRIYLVSGASDGAHYVKPHVKDDVKIVMLKLDYSKSSEDLVPELYLLLKRHFMEDKVQDLDMAVNISSGTGKEHSVIISTLMKLGYGIRLVDLDKEGNILEMI